MASASGRRSYRLPPRGLGAPRRVQEGPACLRLGANATCLLPCDGAPDAGAARCLLLPSVVPELTLGGLRLRRCRRRGRRRLLLAFAPRGGAALRLAARPGIQRLA